ncbi:MAG: nuclear transport factor 2 family protein [Candidatus Rokubacteria bacterium]|nr:nuclear transport factor 2 family protein [Candidatus Rokubacteria bacterium]
MSADSERLVRDFCATWRKKNLDAIMAFLSDECVHHNMPIKPLVGKTAVREFVADFISRWDTIEFEIQHLASGGDVVMTERIDRFARAGKSFELPVAGVFEIAHGRIVAWRDYWDLETWKARVVG